MRILLSTAALAATLVASPAAAQFSVETTQQQVERCVREEKQRDQLALRRHGQRTRENRIIEDQCKAEVARRFDDRILGRTPPPGPPPIAPAYGREAADWTAPGSALVIEGSWHFAGAETKPDNRFLYFIDANHAERGRTGEAWLTSVYERPYRDGATSTAYRVRVDCEGGQWRYRQVAIRDAGFRVLRNEPVQSGWQSARLAPESPIAKVRAMLCEDASPGEPLPASMPAPAEWSRRWFAQNPR